MKKSELKYDFEFSMFSVSKGYGTRTGKFWIEVSEAKLDTVKRVAKFLEWFDDESDPECPFTKAELARLTNDIIQFFADDTEFLYPKYRHAHWMLQKLFCDKYIGRLQLSEAVRLIDFVEAQMSE